MNITINLMQVLNLLIHVAVLIPVVLYLRKLHLRVFGLEAFKKGLVAHAKLHPRVTDMETHRTWLSRYKELEDCPKKEAYLHRLQEVGILDNDGNEIEITSGD